MFAQHPLADSGPDYRTNTLTHGYEPTRDLDPVLVIDRGAEAITSLYQLRPHFRTPKSSRGVDFLVWLTHLSYGVFHDPPNIFGELPHSFVGKLRVIL